jgi:hypothetical protein
LRALLSWRGVLVAAAAVLVAGSLMVVNSSRQRTAAIAYARSNAPLDDLEVSFRPIPAWWPAWAPLPEWLRSVRAVALEGDTVDLKLVVALHEVEQLTLYGIQESGLSSLPRMRRLQQVELSRARMTDAGMEVFRECRRLKVLQIDCASKSLTDAGLQPLLGLPLESFGIINARITDAGVQQLAQLPLTDVTLRRTLVTDAGIEHLAGHPLQRLAVADNPDITPAVVPVFRRIKTLREVAVKGPRFPHEEAVKLYALGYRVSW